MDHEMNDEEVGLGQSTRRGAGWDAAHRQYTCRDGMPVEVPCKTAFIRNLDETKILPSSGIRHARDAKKRLQPRTVISGVEFNRNMRVLFGGSEGIRTIIFPSALRTIKQGAFSYVRSLQKVVLNEDLEVLGTD